MIDLETRKGELIALANELFHDITTLPSDVRSDTKLRTGIQILVREVNTKNLIFFSAGKPTDQAMFFAAEKAVRSAMHGHFASENSQKPFEMQFAGSITIDFEGILLQASCSGLLADEDVVSSMIILSRFTGYPVSFIMELVQRGGGILPKVITSSKESYHYLYKMVRSPKYS